MTATARARRPQAVNTRVSAITVRHSECVGGIVRDARMDTCPGKPVQLLELQIVEARPPSNSANDTAKPARVKRDALANPGMGALCSR